MLEHADCLILLIIIPICSGFAEPDPIFDDAPLNLTVISGRTAILPCTVENRGLYMMTWMHPKRVLISTDDRRVIDDTRMSVERPFVRDWNLHIRHVRYNDSGEYRCTINTNPVQIKRIQLIVKVPPSIVHELSTANVRVREGANVRLVCNSTGIPEPTVRWYRHADDSKEKTDIGNEGHVLVLRNISRHQDGTYECLVDNEIPPAVSRQMKVDVTFPPGIQLRNKKISQFRSKETILECIITASPQAISFWEHQSEQIKTKSSIKYRTEVYRPDDRHTVILSLRISDLHASDFGEYICKASNSLGKDRKSMMLCESYLPTTPKIITTTTTPIKTSHVYIHEVALQLANDSEKVKFHLSSDIRPALNIPVPGQVAFDGPLFEGNAANYCDLNINITLILFSVLTILFISS